MTETAKRTRESPSAILFDLDNTLVDLVHAKMEACRVIVRTADTGDAETLFSYFLRDIHGFEDHRNILDFLAVQGRDDPETVDRCCRIYEEIKIRCTHPYPGVRELLGRLEEQRIALAIVTDASTENARKRLKKAGIEGFFTCLVTPECTGVRKPAPEPFLHALAALRISAGEGLAVGDSPRRDIAPARAVGLTTVYAAYGDRFSSTRQDECSPHHTIWHPLELLDLIDPNGHGSG